MNIQVIEGATRNLGAPKDWKPDVNGTCGVLPIVDIVENGAAFMVSEWKPTAEEVRRIVAGASIHLHVQGQIHPVVALVVQAP